MNFVLLFFSSSLSLRARSRPHIYLLQLNSKGIWYLLVMSLIVIVTVQNCKYFATSCLFVPEAARRLLLFFKTTTNLFGWTFQRGYGWLSSQQCLVVYRWGFAPIFAIYPDRQSTKQHLEERWRIEFRFFWTETEHETCWMDEMCTHYCTLLYSNFWLRCDRLFYFALKVFGFETLLASSFSEQISFSDTAATVVLLARGKSFCWCVFVQRWFSRREEGGWVGADGRIHAILFCGSVWKLFEERPKIWLFFLFSVSQTSPVCVCAQQIKTPYLPINTSCGGKCAGK